MLSLPEVRGVIAAVLGELGGDAAKLELLKPFKMAHVSPRVFWNMVHHLGGDVRAGLEQLLIGTTSPGTLSLEMAASLASHSPLSPLRTSPIEPCAALRRCSR